ncbi:MAG: FKBP-type peptidyl-prolyl cis-trans isomerase [Verrucomicrobiales bacterium]|nr:FKBP-type peptidyl-prolyl cis-trans isomerase [Verrucomicrobiales bacterium]
MQKLMLSMAVTLGVTGWSLSAAEVTSAGDLKEPRNKASYGLGIQAGNMWKNRGANIDWDAYLKGVRDSQSGAKPLLSDAEIREAMQVFQTETQKAFEEKQKVEGDKNKAAGEQFLADNKSKEGVKSTASGLQYKVVKEGSGAKPAATDKVTVHYTGTLIDGKKFDSSVDRGQPASFPLNGVIKGWTEGLQLMTVGSKYQFFIPAELAYGMRAPASIGPNQALVFDVELISIEASAPAQPVTSDIIKVPSADELSKGAKIEVIKADEAQKLIDKEKGKQAPPK